MRYTNLALAAGAAATVSAQRPEDTPICDYYTTALLKENNATNQATLLTLLVNTVVIGNYTQPNVGVSVAGILAPGKVDDTEVNLAPYFSGGLASTNRGGDKGVSVNFLDGGGAEPLKNNKPADDETSNQYFLLTHLYEFFGSLLGCSQQGMTGFDAYSAASSMYKVHKFMDLNYAEVTYFVQQVGGAAASFGVAEDDITAVAKSLNSIFNVRCGPPTAVIKAQGEQLQSICIDEETCPLAEGAKCDQYDEAVEPTSVPATEVPTGTAPATGTATAAPTGSSAPTGGSGSGGSETAAPTGTSAPTTVPTAAAAANGFSVAAVVAGIAAFIL